jgi:hypothetical protein
MKRLSVMLAVGLASLPGSTVAQQKSLKEQLVGTWTLVSCATTVCVNHKGILIFDANGQYAEMHFGPGRANAAAPGAGANFGTWSVNEADKTVTHHYVGALNPANEGTEHKLSVSLVGDELKFVGDFSGARIDETYRRAK